MKKTNTIVKEKNTYEIDILINNTAYIKSVTGKSGLLNITKNEIIGEMDDYHTIYDEYGKFYYQEKTIEEASKENNWKAKEIVRIYDALNEKMLVDGWEVVKKLGKNYNLTVFKSPIDGKLHLFDRYTCRKSTNIFDMSLDDVEGLYSSYNDTYLVVTVDGKKGIYRHNCYDVVPSLVTPIEFDNIEKFPYIVVYTKNNQKYFVGTREDGKTSSNFDTITLDKDKKYIAYCKKGNNTCVYNIANQELLLSEDYDEIRYMDTDDNNYYGEFFFEIIKKGFHGIMSSKINDEIRKSGTGAKVSVLLLPKYDEIKSVHGGFILKTDEKMGLFVGNSHDKQIIEPKYDEIVSLGYNYFALYTNDLCDIGKITSCDPFVPSITNCEIVKDLIDAVIFKKNGKYGLLLSGHHREDVITEPEYDSISNVLRNYFILEKNNKKGFMHYSGKIIIPIEYDEISIGGYIKYNQLDNADVFYFALKKKDTYELAKMHNHPSLEADVEFVSNHTFDKIDFFREIMVFKDKVYSYIYDYNEKLLKTLPADALITQVAKPGNDEKYFYCLNGVYYYYKKGKFEEVYTEDNELYLTKYETDTDLFEVRSYNKDELDSFCSVIDAKNDTEAEKSLIEMSKKGDSITDYPTLSLKRIKKHN